MTTREDFARVRRIGDVAIIDLAGDVNAAAEAALNEAWNRAMVGSPHAIALNFDAASFINSTGIALIVGLLAKARTRSIPVRAYGLNSHYRKIFEITRLSDFMGIESDEESAVGGAEGKRDGRGDSDV